MSPQTTQPAPHVSSTIQAITQHIQEQIPAVAAATVAIEQVAHQLPGQTKAAAVLTAVQTTAMVTSTISPNITVQAIAGLTALFCAVFNASGFFNHGAPPNIAGNGIVPPQMQASAAQQQAGQ